MTHIHLRHRKHEEVNWKAPLAGLLAGISIAGAGGGVEASSPAPIMRDAAVVKLMGDPVLITGRQASRQSMSGASGIERAASGPMPESEEHSIFWKGNPQEKTPPPQLEDIHVGATAIERIRGYFLEELPKNLPSELADDHIIEKLIEMAKGHPDDDEDESTPEPDSDAAPAAPATPTVDS